MKIAVVYNRISKRVINLFGQANQEKYGLKNIKRITDALKAGKHQVAAFEGDKDLLDRLEEFMPRVLKSERPGLVFNLSYGIQGEARYTHVPGMLEMVGIPYVGSGPLAHSLALDKVVAKMIFRQHGLSTPDFAVMRTPETPVEGIRYPAIVKPQSEAVSFGIRVVQDEAELREAAGVIFERFQQAVLVEQFIEGREVNVGLLGNGPPEALPPAELDFQGGPTVYSYEDKVGKSDRSIGVVSPADLSPELTERVQDLAKAAFSALRCCDCARVDMRIDADDTPYLLEINSLPSLGARGSYVAGAAAAGLDFTALVNRLVDVASARYFGTPSPPEVGRAPKDPRQRIFGFLTERRDRMERRVRDWVRLSSRTDDPVGVREAARRIDAQMTELGLRLDPELGDGRTAWTYETAAGLEGGTLLVVHADAPLDAAQPQQGFRRDPEFLYGEGVALSRGPLVMLEYALRALRQARLLARLPLGVFVHADEGRDCVDSAAFLQRAGEKAARVLVLRTASSPGKVVHRRRGQRVYELVAEAATSRPGRSKARPEVLPWFGEKIGELTDLSSGKERVSVSVLDMQTSRFPERLPHKLRAKLLVTYPSEAHADAREERIREILAPGGVRWALECLTHRPPMTEQRGDAALFQSLANVARDWDIELDREGSIWPSSGGLVPATTPTLCGLGPVGNDIYTPNESIQRISLVERTLLLAAFLAGTQDA